MESCPMYVRSVAVINGKKVLVALSGGVDSSVCVHLLKQEGYAVSAAVMKMSPLHQAAVDAAKAAADALGVPLTVLDMQAEFEEKVIAYFVEEYRRGRTPNPCVRCNPTVKFHALFAEMERQGCDFAASGHYARTEDGRLLRGKSTARDQSYMLYRLTRRELSRLLLPLGDLEKPEVRWIAAELSLQCADAPDSQENCFIEGKDHTAFLRERLGELPAGDFIAPDGRICGRHDGIYQYTVGQRKGLGIALGRPVFVRKIDPVKNCIYLADAGGDTVEEALLSEVLLHGEAPAAGHFPAQVKLRSAAQPVAAEVTLLPCGGAKLRFTEPQRAVAPGQSAVFYDGELVLGGGIIEENETDVLTGGEEQ